MPRRAEFSDIRNEILDATIDLIATEGMQAATMRRIAERTGCTTGRVTHYFSSKEELMVAALARMRSAAAGPLALAASQAGGIDRIRQFLLATLPNPDGSGREAAWRVWIGLWNEALIEDYAQSEWDRRAEGYELILRQVVESARADGGLREDVSTDDIVRLLAPIVYGVGSDAILRPATWSRDAQKRAIELALAGIASNGVATSTTKDSATHAVVP